MRQRHPLLPIPKRELAERRKAFALSNTPASLEAGVLLYGLIGEYAMFVRSNASQSI